VTAPRTPNSNKAALAKVAPTADEVTKILQGLGVLEVQRSEFHRIKVDGAVFDVDGTPYVSNPRTNSPAFVARIVAPPEQYQALWHDIELATALDRPSAIDKFCKSHFNNPDEARKVSDLGFSCEACPVAPWKRDNEYGKKCAWKGDIQLQMVDPATGQFFTKDEDGKTVPDDTIYTLTLSTTAMIEWQGTSRDPKAGNVSPFNFIHKLANYGMEQSDDPNAGIVAAINALGLGLVVAEWRSLKASSSDGARTWYVPSATPIMILDYEEVPQLPPATVTAPSKDELDLIETDDLPF
jgi:hypothetical protein